jgi:ketosteroid isomerase-like protein
MKSILPLIAAVFMVSLLHGQTNKPENAGQGGLPKAGQEVLALEQAWADAVQHQDVGKIDQIQAEEFVFTDPAGQVWTKTRELAVIKAGDLAIDSFELSELKVRLYDNTAVVTLRIVWHGQFRGTEISGPQRMTDVFVKRDGRWQCVASQATRIPPQPVRQD